MTYSFIRTTICLYCTDKLSSRNTASDLVSIALVSTFGCNTILIKLKKKKVNQSRYRPGVAHRVPGS